MHGEESRPAARPPSLVAREDKNLYLREDVQQRVILGALRWVDALAKLLKGRTGCAHNVSSNVRSCDFSRVALSDSVVDAPPLIEMLPAEAKLFLESFSHGCCCRRK